MPSAAIQGEGMNNAYLDKTLEIFVKRRRSSPSIDVSGGTVTQQQKADSDHTRRPEKTDNKRSDVHQLEGGVRAALVRLTWPSSW